MEKDERNNMIIENFFNFIGFPTSEDLIADVFFGDIEDNSSSEGDSLDLDPVTLCNIVMDDCVGKA